MFMILLKFRHPVCVWPLGHWQRKDKQAVIQKKGQRVAFCPVGGRRTERARENPFGHERKEFNLVGQTDRETEVNCRED